MSDNPFVKGQVILIDKPLNWTSFQVGQQSSLVDPSTLRIKKV